MVLVTGTMMVDGVVGMETEVAIWDALMAWATVTFTTVVVVVVVAALLTLQRLEATPHMIITTVQVTQ